MQLVALDHEVLVGNAGSLAQGIAVTGTYSAASGGRGTAMFNNSAKNVNAIYYPVSATRVIFIEIDSAQIGVGEFDQQQQ